MKSHYDQAEDVFSRESQQEHMSNGAENFTKTTKNSHLKKTFF
jgi:hypothetical protein